MDRSHEREPRPIASYVDTVNHLRDDEGLVLSRNRATRIGGVRQSETFPVHYEDLNRPQGAYQTPIGSPVTDEFKESAQRLVREERYVQQGPAYPILSIIDSTTGETQSEVVDIARLISDERISLYSSPARLLQGGEFITIDFTPLVEHLVRRCGRDADSIITIGKDGATTVRGIGLTSKALLTLQHTLDATVEPYTLNLRDETTIALLQMNSAQTFAQHYHRVLESTDHSVEVALRVDTKPDMQTIMVELIDLVEVSGFRLYCGKCYIATGERGVFLSIVDDSMAQAIILAEDTLLDMMVYNAYNAAIEIFREPQY